LAPDPDLIRSLAKLLDETGLSEIEYEADGQRIHVARHTAAPAAHAAAQPASETPVAVAKPPTGNNGASHNGNGADDNRALKAPLVGIAYLCAEPGAAPYVRVGDTVAEGQTLLIIEAMKVMNQIRAPHAGRIARVYVGDAEPVEYGSALMLIE
jgi:acetyl-CoA carboxylase biotin carboxyl carrier protein